MVAMVVVVVVVVKRAKRGLGNETRIVGTMQGTVERRKEISGLVGRQWQKIPVAKPRFVTNESRKKKSRGKGCLFLFGHYPAFSLKFKLSLSLSFLYSVFSFSRNAERAVNGVPVNNVEWRDLLWVFYL